MKKFYVSALMGIFVTALVAQQPNQYGVLYNILNTKCQNASCHSSTSEYYLQFDGDSDAVYNAIFNVLPANATSIANHEKLVNPEMPYASYLLRKIAGAGFDTDLAIDSTQGNLMKDINGNPLSNVEIEYFRQWIRFGALETYQNPQHPIAQPDFALINQYYTDSIVTPFLQKPTKPDPAKGIQVRMGPQFLPVTGAVEQEVLEQNIVYFPFLPEVVEVDGYMNEQSHHFLLFQYPDSTSARDPSQGAADITDIGQVTPGLYGVVDGIPVGGVEPFSGPKNLVGAWQTNNNVSLPKGTALMWNQTTYLDMDYHVRNYNATSVLPCDFYFNVYFEARNPNTIPMVSHLVNNANFGNFNINCTPWPLGSLPQGQTYTGNYDDQDNTNSPELRYVWMTAGHTHQYGTGFQIIRRDSTGELADIVYRGDSDYTNQYNLGIWDWHHPPIEYFSTLLPVQFGASNSTGKGSGLVAQTSWLTDSACIHFGFTTNEEMQLFYYMYTTQAPPASVDTTTGISAVAPPPMYFVVEPNPVDNNGKLVYNLDKTAKIQASVIDITGKTIATLAEETEPMGLHEISLSNGQKLSAGIYFAKLLVNGSLYTKKFVVTQ